MINLLDMDYIRSKKLSNKSMYKILEITYNNIEITNSNSLNYS